MITQVCTGYSTDERGSIPGLFSSVRPDPLSLIQPPLKRRSFSGNAAVSK